MVYISQQAVKGKPAFVQGAKQKMSRFNDVGMSEEEARELMFHEKTLMEEGRRMNINYFTDNLDVGKLKEVRKVQRKSGSDDDKMNLPLNQKEYKMYTP